MHRRIAPLFLAVLIALPVVAPVSAADPTASPSSEPTAAPAATPEPTPTEPAPTAEPTPTEALPTEAPTTEPAVEPSTEPSAEPTPAASLDAPAAQGAPDTTGRFIVMLKNGTDTSAVVSKVRKRDGVTADRSFTRAFRGFSAKLDKKQKRELLDDPKVVAVVPAEVVHLTQPIPTGVSRVGGRINS